MRRVGVGLADGVRGGGAGNRAKICPEGGGELAPSRPNGAVCCCFPQAEGRGVGSRRAQPQKMLLKSFIKEEERTSGRRPGLAAFLQPSSRRERNAQQKSLSFDSSHER